MNYKITKAILRKIQELNYQNPITNTSNSILKTESHAQKYKS